MENLTSALFNGTYSDCLIYTYKKDQHSLSKERLIQKTALTTLNTQRAEINWPVCRHFTPNDLCGYIDKKRVLFSIHGSSRIQLFTQNKESQGLIFLGSKVEGASVTTKIKTETDRKSEKKTTFIQYDKTRFSQKEADFKVDPENYLDCINYEGGHLIDHQFSAGNSHTTKENYFPVNYYYNKNLKNFLVNRSDSYIEIPLLTPKPPLLGVKGQKDIYHPIPVGIIFVQIVKEKIKDIYYFPNNKYDYKALANKLELKKDYAKTITPLFKLKKDFHALFRPAILIDFDNVKNGEGIQTRRENRFLETLDSISEASFISESTYLSEKTYDPTLITKMCYELLNYENVDPELYLSCNMYDYDDIDSVHLTAPFNALGKYLVHYVIRNALKSEVISVKSRLMFLNLVTSLLQEYDYTKDNQRPLKFFDSLAPEFCQALDEMDKITHNMNQDELFKLANLYMQLSNPVMHPLMNEGFKIYINKKYFDYSIYFSKYIKILKILTEQHNIESFEDEYVWNFIHLLIEAQGTFDYLTEPFEENEIFEEDIFIKAGKFLRKMREPALLLLKKNSKDKSITTELTISNENTTIRSDFRYLFSHLETLGAPF